MLIACSKVWVVLRNCKVTSSLKPGRSAGLFHWQIKRPTRCVPEPPPNSQHAPVLRNPPRPTATPPRRGAEHIPSRARNPPRPTATPPRRGVFPIPSLEGCRVSGGVGCPLPVSQGTHPGLRPPLQGGGEYIPSAAHIPSVSSPLRKRPGSVITRVLHVYDRYANSRDTRGE